MDKAKKIFLAVCIVVVLLVIALVVYITIDGNKTKELVCTSNAGNVTIYYDSTTVIGYTQNGYDYSLLSEKSRAETIGIEKYIEEFSNTFVSTTNGACKK